MASQNGYLRSDVDKGEVSPDKDLRLRSDADKLTMAVQVAKVNGITLANIAKFNGITKANTAKFNGLWVTIP